MKTTGVITYNYTLDGGARMSSVTPDDQNLALTLIETDEQMLQRLLARLHPSIASIVVRLKSDGATPAGATPSADEAKFVRDGKAEIQV